MSSPFGIYIHIPFCDHKCPYCGFASGRYSGEQQQQYLVALCKEIKIFSERNPKQICNSIYFGGGTPSSFAVQDIEIIIATLCEHFSMQAELEISFEMHPNHLEKTYLTELTKAGVTRLSIGVQSFTDSTLLTLGRHYTGEAAKGKIGFAREFWPHQLALDLMYGIRNHSLESVQKDVETFLTFGPDHLSCYALSIDNQSGFHRREEYGLLADEEAVIKQYLYLHDVLKEEGFEHYEIANWAKKKSYCKHNVNIWQGNAYKGFGLAAQSFWNNVHTIGPNSMQSYLENPSLHSSELPIQTNEESWESYLLGATRHQWGIPLETFPEKTQETVKELCNQKLLQNSGGVVLPTTQGWLINNEVVRKLAE